MKVTLPREQYEPVWASGVKLDAVSKRQMTSNVHYDWPMEEGRKTFTF